MRTAVLADIHANREALDACLAHARRQGVDRYAFLGDLVGYGAEPAACIERVRGLADTVCLLGNHDAAALGGLLDAMHPLAREAAYWTRTQLDDAHRAFLAALPLTAKTGERLYVHASAHRPENWEYIAGPLEAQRCMAAADTAGIVVGHVHQPLLYFEVRGGMQPFAPRPGEAVPLPSRRRWLAVAGSVGQPRDGNPAASWLLIDDDARELVFHRVPYDHHAAAAKVLAAGLPAELAERLRWGW